MTGIVSGLLSHSDRLQIESINHRLVRNKVISGNIANAETPGFRSIGYDFENQLAAMSPHSEGMGLKATNPRHFVTEHTTANGELEADVYMRPTESVGEDGNTVDMDQEMARMAENQILYRAAVDLINRKLGTVRYAISGGGR